jgi:hypothetical protein
LSGKITVSTKTGAEKHPRPASLQLASGFILPKQDFNSKFIKTIIIFNKCNNFH